MSDVLALAGVSVVRGVRRCSRRSTGRSRRAALGRARAQRRGKTTLLQLASGRMHPSSGVVGILGEVLGAVESSSSGPAWTGLRLARRPHSGRRGVGDVVVTASTASSAAGGELRLLDHARAGELLDALGASHLRDRTFGTLSEGERKRVQIARPHDRPELMLLDEPAAGLDLGGREESSGGSARSRVTSWPPRSCS